MTDTLTPVLVSANYAASAGQLVLVDATLGAVEVTLPASSSATDGALVEVLDATRSGNRITISSAGSDSVLYLGNSGSELTVGSSAKFQLYAAGTTWYAVGGYSPPALNPTGILVTPTYTARPNELVQVNSATQAVTITLPTNPPGATLVAVKDVQGLANAITVVPAGSDTFCNADANPYPIPDSGCVTFEYTDPTGLKEWNVISSDTPA